MPSYGSNTPSCSAVPARGASSLADHDNPMDRAPLVVVLAAVRNAARDFRDGEGEDPGAQLVALGRRAHAALMWLDADEAGDIDTASRLLDIAFGRRS